MLEARGAGSGAEGRDGDCQVREPVAVVSQGGPATGASFPERRDSLLRSGAGPEGEPGAAGLQVSGLGGTASPLADSRLAAASQPRQVFPLPPGWKRKAKRLGKWLTESHGGSHSRGLCCLKCAV